MINKECLRCNYTWESRIKEEPKQCPHCHSPYWNKPRQDRYIRGEK
jgi:DNA-directed RNA polymerase subunit RPC12/RpoP